jgi:hypothetical protein
MAKLRGIFQPPAILWLREEVDLSIAPVIG